mmetsp:Transcript_104351/g.336466  ORF Transcript_104351/g.336466 Transcript_104351/m.336466 type:complete len:129 (-) Transcript_104351:80-466(-)
MAGMRAVLLVLVLAVALTLQGCGKKKDDKPKPKPSTNTTTTTTTTNAMCRPMAGFDCDGPNIQKNHTGSAEACCGLCLGTENCTAWTWDNATTDKEMCFLKTACKKTAKASCTSGESANGTESQLMHF